MTNPTVYGPSYSAYVRTTRLALEEKGVAYDLVDVAMMAGAHKQPDFLRRNPFGKLPAFAHDGLSLYETGAITRYIDRALPGDGPVVDRYDAFRRKFIVPGDRLGRVFDRAIAECRTRSLPHVHTFVNISGKIA